mgnify:CR=1 FL=1
MSEDNTLGRKLGLSAVIALGVGSTIGTGIFSTMSEVAMAAGSSLFLVLAFLIGAILQIPASLCYSELSSAYPEDGGYYGKVGPRLEYYFNELCSDTNI